MNFNKIIIYLSYKNIKIKEISNWFVVEIKEPTHIRRNYINPTVSVPYKNFQSFQME